MDEDAMIIVEMKKHFQLRAIEWWSACTMASWGLMVVAFPHMFQDNPAARALIEWAPQQVWGLAALIAGSIRVTALFINGLWYRTPAIRWATSMISILIWFLITVAFMRSPIVNMGIVIYSWHVIADMYSAFRSASDYVEAEAQQRLKKLSIATFKDDGGSNVHSLAAR